MRAKNAFTWVCMCERKIFISVGLSVCLSISLCRSFSLSQSLSLSPALSSAGDEYIACVCFMLSKSRVRHFSLRPVASAVMVWVCYLCAVHGSNGILCAVSACRREEKMGVWPARVWGGGVAHVMSKGLTNFAPHEAKCSVCRILPPAFLLTMTS